MTKFKLTHIPASELEATKEDLELEGWSYKVIAQSDGLFTVEAWRPATDSTPKPPQKTPAKTATVTPAATQPSILSPGVDTTIASDLVPPKPVTPIDATSDLLGRLVTVYRGENIRHPQLKAVSLAQWLLESGRGTSKLAKEHYNFGGLKWRKEMSPYATRVSYNAHDGKDYYCKFATLESFINGYWAFLNRKPYTGWEEHTHSAEAFINFIGPIYTPPPGYAGKVLELLSEAEGLLADRVEPISPPVTSGGVDLGTIVIDPGHGGTTSVAGSSSNNAISWSGVKEKKLTLEYSLLLREALFKQAAAAGENIGVVLTRTSDVNLTGSKRAGLAYEKKASLFLSIHFNGASNSNVRGTETFYRAPENGNLNLADDIAFAQAVQSAVFKSIQLLDDRARDRKVKPDTKTKIGALGVLNDTRLKNNKRAKADRCHAALLEIEFISSRAVDKLIVSGPDAQKNKTKVMAALAKAIRKYLKNM